jgi:hypothetical protein
LKIGRAPLATIGFALVVPSSFLNLGFGGRESDARRLREVSDCRNLIAAPLRRSLPVRDAAFKIGQFTRAQSRRGQAWSIAPPLGSRQRWA